MLGQNCRKLWDVGGIMAHIRGCRKLRDVGRNDGTYQRGLYALAKPQKASGAKGRSWQISDRTVR